MVCCESTSKEKYLEKVTVGKLKQHDAEIILHEYDANWPALFEREAKRICGVLGDTVLQIEHIGSTSVQGLCAKPVIDILLAVADSSAESTYVPQLEMAGYILRIREPDWFQHRLFKGPDTDINLHVFSQGVAEIERMICFRNWLRSHDGDRELYANTKRELARQKWEYIQYYADAKTAVVREIMERVLLNELEGF
jgi:GrpB-like predicted nucleotidyltransferase (UPF0157 family)